jgi:capsular polysaccharide biosynthesis protein
MEQNVDIVRSLRRGWWLILLLAVVGAGTAALVTARQEPVYETSAMLVVAPTPETTDTSEIIRSLDALDRRTVIATFARIPSTREVRQAVGEELGMHRREIRLFRIRGSVVTSTNILRIEVSGPDGEKAAAIANSAAVITARDAHSLYRVYSLRLLARAESPGRPSFPDPRRNLLVGVALGVFLGIAAALVLDRLRRQPDPTER